MMKPRKWGGINMMNKIEMVSLKVRNLVDISNFYQQVIGLVIIKESDNEIWLGADGSKETLLHLIKIENATKTYNKTGMYHVAFKVPNRQVLGSFLTHVMNHPGFSGTADHGYSEAIYLEDPEYNGIEVYCDKPKEVWDIRDNGKIYGVTDPLDYFNLIKEAGEFTKLPTETMIGHIHLNVADLEKTKIFYRDILGMSLKMDFAKTAKFFAYDEYHHHVGVNIWSGANMPPMIESDLGLNYYMIALNKETYKTVKDNLTTNDIPFEEVKTTIKVVDPSGINIIIKKVLK